MLESRHVSRHYEKRQRQSVTGRLKTSHFEALQNQPVVFDVIHSVNKSRQAIVV